MQALPVVVTFTSATPELTVPVIVALSFSLVAVPVKVVPDWFKVIVG